MAWIESHQKLVDHPKVEAFAHALGIDQDAALGKIHRLWWWALDHAENGDISVFNRAIIARAMNVDAARADVLWNALQTPAKEGGCGFVDPDGKLHDWMQYAGRLVNKRKDDAERKRKDREAPKPRRRTGRPADVPTTSSARPEDVQRTSSGHPEDGAQTALGRRLDGARTVPNRTVPNQQNLTGEAAVSVPTPAPPAKPVETAGASRPVAKAEQKNGDRPALTAGDLCEWNTAAEAIRRRGWQESSVRRVLRWGLSEPRAANLDLFLLRFVATVFETQDKARAEEIKDPPAYVIGWMISNQSPPSDAAMRVARQSMDRVRTEKSKGVVVKDFVSALLAAWDDRPA